LDGPLGEITAVHNKVKTEERREDLKNIIFTNMAIKPDTDMTRYIRKIKNLVNTPQFEPFVEDNLNLSDNFLEKFDNEEEKTVEFINKEKSGDEELRKELKDVNEKYKEKVKKRRRIMDLKNKIEKEKNALKSMDLK